MTNKLTDLDRWVRNPGVFASEPFRESLGRIVMSKGVYDLTHAAHATALHDARTRGDTLVVALASDISTTQRKGPSRPFLTFSERVVVLSSLRWVDLVVEYDSLSPFEIVRQVRPHLFCASHFDYFTVAEKAALERDGVGFEILRRPRHRSTTDLVRAVEDGAHGR